MLLFNNIPLLMVIAFLLLTLIVGLYLSKNTVTFREYAIGNKQFPTATLVATVLATSWGGGGLIRTVQLVHNGGLYWIIAFLSSIFVYYPLSELALRIFPFIQNLSMAETIGKVYGKYPRIIAALSSICVAIIILIGQIVVMSQAISFCIDGVNHQIITICAALVLVFYSIFGGIRAVTYTDVLQFVTFSIIIPLLAWFLFIKTNKPITEIIPFLQKHEKFQFRSVFHFDTKLVSLLMLILGNLFLYIRPDMIQRMYMASGPIQANRVFRYAMLFNSMVVFFIILVGLFVFIGAPDLPIGSTWPYIMTHIPTIFKGLICIGLLSMTMSTADSCLNACAVMVSHDLLETIRGVKKTSDFQQLRLAKLACLVVGQFSMVIAFHFNDLLQLVYFALDFSLPIITAPFILAVFGFRGTSRTALIGMATGVLTILAWNKWVMPATGISGAFISMVANGLAMMATHYLLPQPARIRVEPDDHYRQIKQTAVRRKEAKKEQTILFTLLFVGVFCIIASLFCFIFSGYAIGVPLFQLTLGIGLIGYAYYLLQKSIPEEDEFVIK